MTRTSDPLKQRMPVLIPLRSRPATDQVSMGVMLAVMRIVWRPQNLMAGQIGKQLLLAHGVPCHLAGEHLSGGLGELPAFGMYALMVEAEQFEEADRLLRESGLLEETGELEA